MLQPTRKPILWIATSALLVLLAPALAPVEAGEPDATMAQEGDDLIELIEPTDDAALATQGQCRTNRLAFREETGSVTTKSTDWAAMPNTGVSINHGGNGNACVIVNFSAELTTRPDQSLRLRARIIGHGISSQEPFVARTTDMAGIFRATSYQFIFPNVPPGQYFVRIEWRKGTPPDNGELSTARDRTLTVHHTAG